METNFIYSRENSTDVLNHSECELILKNALGSGIEAKLIGFTILPELQNVGYLGEYFHLKLNYQLGNILSDTHELRVFIKSVPFKNATLESFNELSLVLRKEATLYQSLLNKLRKYSKSLWCAECYFERNDLFVLQNIVDLGYTQSKDSAVFLTRQEVLALLKSLATLHASSIAYEEANQVCIGVEMKEILFEATVSPTVAWFTAGLKAIVALALNHPSYQDVNIQKFLREELIKSLDSVYEMVNPSKKYRNVFCHRDPWGANVFFKSNNPSSAAVLVDFQLCRYCPAAIDVLMAVYLNLDHQERKSIETDLYQEYYQNFAKELRMHDINANDHMTFANFQQSLKDLKLFIVLYNCVSSTIIRVPKNYLNDLKQNHPEEFNQYANVDRTKKVLELIQNDDDFRKCMYNCIDELMELILQSKV